MIGVDLGIWVGLPLNFTVIIAVRSLLIHRLRLSLLSGRSCLPSVFHFLTALLYLYVYSLIVIQLHFRIFGKYFLNLHIYAFRKCSSIIIRNSYPKVKILVFHIVSCVVLILSGGNLDFHLCSFLFKEWNYYVIEPVVPE